MDNSFGNSLAFTMNNTYGTHVLLEAARAYGGVRRFIAVSTDEVYGESSVGRDEGCNETSALEPTNPYSAAKAGAGAPPGCCTGRRPAARQLAWLRRSAGRRGRAESAWLLCCEGKAGAAPAARGKAPCTGWQPGQPHALRQGQPARRAAVRGAARARAEMMVKAYMTSYKLPCIITRGNNVYGPHQFPEKLVPKFTLLAKRGEALPIHGGGTVRAAPRRPQCRASAWLRSLSCRALRMLALPRMRTQPGCHQAGARRRRRAAACGKAARPPPLRGAAPSAARRRPVTATRRPAPP